MTTTVKYIPYPKNAPENFNGSATPCDVFDGPCSCGAWHKGNDWNEKIRKAALKESLEN